MGSSNCDEKRRTIENDKLLPRVRSRLLADTDGADAGGDEAAASSQEAGDAQAEDEEAENAETEAQSNSEG